MKRKEKKLKSKFGKSYRFRWVESCPWLMKYDRKFVARHCYGARHLPFSRGNDGDWHSSWLKWGMRTYIERFLYKHVGMDADTVFHQFSRMGWRNTKDMYEMWSFYVDPCQENKDSTYYISEKNILYAYSNDDDAGQQLEQPERPEVKDAPEVRRSPEELNHSQLLHNSKVKVPEVWCCRITIRDGIYVDRMGKFYVKYNGRVLLCNVYHIVCRNNQQWELANKNYSNVTILGVNRKQRRFHNYFWYGANENLEDMRNPYGGICWNLFHDLHPMINICEVRCQLK